MFGCKSDSGITIKKHPHKRKKLVLDTTKYCAQLDTEKVLHILINACVSCSLKLATFFLILLHKAAFLKFQIREYETFQV